MSKNHCEIVGLVSAPVEAVFAHLDDHARLSGQMSRRSWMMAGSRMAIEVDAQQGHGVGARIRMAGRFLGIPLSLDEIVTAWEPPLRKKWETIGSPCLIDLLNVGCSRHGEGDGHRERRH